MSKVNLIALSKPSAITGCHTAEQLVAYAARVSNPSNQNNTETAPKLLGYLAKNAHWSPFEMVHMTMEIKTTRDISRQIIRHRSFAFQEFSQRYADPVDELNHVTREARLQDLKNRQNSIEVPDGTKDEQGFDLKHFWEEHQNNVWSFCAAVYKYAVDNGIAKEQARAVLPEGLTETTLYMSGSLRSWIHYCELRMGHGTQKEHMEIARQCWTIIEQHFPSVVKALEGE